MNQRNVSHYKSVFFSQFDCSTLVRNLINIVSGIFYLGALNLSAFRSCRKTEIMLISLADHGSLFSDTKLAFLWSMFQSRYWCESTVVRKPETWRSGFIRPHGWRQWVRRTLQHIIYYISSSEARGSQNRQQSKVSCPAPKTQVKSLRVEKNNQMERLPWKVLY